MSSKDILIDQLGGNENSYKILIKTYCNHIRDNEDLVPFFGDYDEERLYNLQEMFLKAAFTPDEGPGGKMHRRVKAHHRQLFDKGLDDTHFDSLKEHFLDALNDYCLEDDAYEACSNDLDSLRYMFEENYRRRSGRGRYRRTSLGHGSEMEEEEPSIAGIPRRCASLPPVKKGRSKRDTQNTGAPRNSKRGMLKPTKSGGSKLTTMFHATRNSDGKDGPDSAIKRHNSGDLIKTMLNSASLRRRSHSKDEPEIGGMKRSGSGDKLRALLHSGRTNSGDKLKSMLNGTLSLSSSHSRDGLDTPDMKRSSSGDRFNAILNPVIKQS